MNDRGQLGINSTTNSIIPVNVSILNNNAVSVVCGTGSSFVVDSNGNLWAWGRNEYQQLGIGTNVDSLVPINITTMLGSQLLGHKIVTLACGDCHIIALDDMGNVWAWGRNHHGRLENSIQAIDTQYQPFCISLLSSSVLNGIKMTNVSCGFYHSVAIDITGDIWTWGLNTKGQLGTGVATDMPVNGYSPTSLSLSTISPLYGRKFMSVSAGPLTSTALEKGGTIWAWGQNITGQLGYNSNNDINLVPRVVMIRGILSTSSSNNTAIINNLGELLIWGSNNSGQLGIGSTTNSIAPTFVNPKLSLQQLTAISCGMSHMVALNYQGVLFAWGNNDDGQLGTNSTASTLVPVTVTNAISGHKMIDVSCGIAHTVILDSTGAVWTCGNNQSGQLGTNSTTNGTVFTNLTSLNGNPVFGLKFVKVLAGAFHTMALDETGKLWIWGQNTNGQLGNNSVVGSLVPIIVSSLTGRKVVRMVASEHTVVLDDTGNLWVWGRNDNGQLGINSTTNSLEPANLTSLAGSPLFGRKIVDVCVGMGHTIVLDDAGVVWAWGSNNLGQLGINSTVSSLVPVNVSTYAGSPLMGRKVVLISIGYNHAMVKDNLGAIWTWGDNSSGQLGNNSTTNSLVPVQMLHDYEDCDYFTYS